MDTPEPLFTRLRADVATGRDADGSQARIALWASLDPALSGLARTANVLDACSDGTDPERARAILAGLLRIAGEEPLAARLVLGALCPALSQVGRALVRSWQAERQDVDQSLATAAWARITTLAGSEVAEPTAAIVGGARDEVRGQLRRQAGHQPLALDGLALDEPPLCHLQALASPPPDDSVEVAEWFASAVRRKVVSLDEARLVVLTRALGETPTELARAHHQRPGTLRMRRHRAEAALRAIA
jgi:DNA-directed RNA polymerase specialized sigma24 family protein